MFRLTTGPYDRRGIIGDGRVRRWACWDWEGFAPSGRVGGDGLDEADEVVGGERRVVDGIFRVRNVEQERVWDVTECCEIVVTGLSNDGLKGSYSGGKDCGDFFGRRGGEGIGTRKSWPLYRMRR